MKMTIKEAKEVFINRGFVNGIYDGDKWRESVVVISKWLEQEPCEDAISRKEVIDTIFAECSGENLDIDFAKVLLLRRAIKALPSVTPLEPAIEIKTVTNAEEAEAYPINENLIKGLEEFTKMMFKQGQAKSEET